MAMSFRYEPSRVTGAALAGTATLELPTSDEIADAIAARAAVGSTPFADYSRHLTPEGGILIAYKDIDRNVGYAMLRIFAWSVATGLSVWMVFSFSGLAFLPALGCSVLLAAVNGRIVRTKIAVKHTIEIRPDGMIVDGSDFFSIEDMGTNWPGLEVKDDDPDRMVIAGVCGTRFIEYMTANRVDECDRMPEVLAADLQDAMEQLWGRSEILFANPAE
jgi:hypothetical protein